MIRHRPPGLGHPYRTEPDQRVPVQPIAGEPIWLGATSDGSLTELWLETSLDGVDARVPAHQVTQTPPGGYQVAHLAAPTARSGSQRRRAWEVEVPAPPPGVVLRYRFIGRGPSGWTRTSWHRVTSARWQATGGRLIVSGSEAVSDRLVPASTSWLVGTQGAVKTRIALRLTPEEHVLGFGERFNAVDQRGQCIDATVFEQYKHQGLRTYLPMPFAIVTGGQGWGFHIATSYRTWYDVGATDPGLLRIEAELDSHGGSEGLKIHLFEGTPEEVLRAFLEQTGWPRLPPDWVFRLWISGNEWNTQARVLTEVERSRREDIPVGVVVIEAWSDEQTFTAFRDARYEPHGDGRPHRLADFHFPAEGAWPDPKAMVDELHRHDIRVMLWQVPLLKARPTPTGQARFDRDSMTARGYAVKRADGRPYRNLGWWFPGALLPDFTNPDARAWWLEKRSYLVEELGIDGFKTDGGEHAWGSDLRYWDGSRGVAGNNRYPVHYQAAYHELLESAGREPVTFSRAGFTGSASYPCHWAGDEDSTWEAFRASIVAGLTAASSGVFFWGWDLAGFSGEVPSAELYLRATAMACFCPIMQYHSEYNHHHRPNRDRTPWNVAERTGDDRVIPVFRRFVHVREALLPYITSQARRAVSTARPLMRPLFFDHPHDSATWDWPYQFQFGDELLVAPVCEPGVSAWSVYLPRGRWSDAWTGQSVEGELVVRSDAPLDRIPLFTRSELLGQLIRAAADRNRNTKRSSLGQSFMLSSGRQNADP